MTSEHTMSSKEERTYEGVIDTPSDGDGEGRKRTYSGRGTK